VGGRLIADKQPNETYSDEKAVAARRMIRTTPTPHNPKSKTKSPRKRLKALIIPPLRGSEVESYRAQAKTARRQAQAESDEATVKQFLRTAEQYDQLARNIEKADR
jgi:hypothetical protein